MPEKKQCGRCYQWKDESGFYRMGVGKLRPECSECTAQIQKRARFRNGRGTQLADRYRDYYHNMREQGYRRVNNQWVLEE